jgi:hypothetical protein
MKRVRYRHIKWAFSPLGSGLHISIDPFMSDIGKIVMVYLGLFFFVANGLDLI